MVCGGVSFLRERGREGERCGDEIGGFLLWEGSRVRGSRLDGLRD